MFVYDHLHPPDLILRTAPTNFRLFPRHDVINTDTDTDTDALHYTSEQEHKRTQESSNVDDRTQHEIYAHPFMRSVMAGVASVMCSYSRYSRILKKVLRS